MVRLRIWQWIVLALPIAVVIGFLLISAGLQIHEWGINWIWAIVALIFVGWRWLLVKWTQPALSQVEAIVAELSEETIELSDSPATNATRQAETEVQKILAEAQFDPPIWQDWNIFWQRCQSLIRAIANIYYPDAQKPLLNIYVPQAYSLLRGTVDDLDQWMQRLAPVLNQVTVGQAVQAYEIYQKLEPSARKVLQAWNWAQWFLNPAVAVARTATQSSSSKATQELLGNLSQMLREAVLRNLARQAISLYSGKAPLVLPAIETPEKFQTLKEVIAQATPVETVAQKPVSLLLVGRTGAGKSSLINTLFVQAQAKVDALPSTDQIQDYRWETESGETLTLWDTPGYEQVERSDFRQQVLDYAAKTDLVLLVSPALDPALQMDLDFLNALKAQELPTLAIVTQVDRLRPIREWNPPYNWQFGDRPKEVSIREAVAYRQDVFGEVASFVLPLVTAGEHREAWGVDELSIAILNSVDPAKQARLARFLKNIDARTVSAAKIIDRYTFQMATTQGLTAFLKSPVLRFLSTIATGSPTLALLLAEQIPIEQLPIVVGKLQMAYDLYQLLQPTTPLDFKALWSILSDSSSTPDRVAWAFGHALTEYWTQNLSIENLEIRYRHYLDAKPL
ncbi:GTP-binding protein HSR1-related protein [Leptolyngbya boryana NIES-2135]|jgi:small GTP-binding protein|uniref:GTP-binding protein HSR1-related protein n=1 Tax=Leptolyngbya boryana NIES-2135 TaxID=1973484 RepID=A0A1Z4JC91_LEPBY|nr:MULTISPECIES: GTPase [Leptolyngbya]BAY54298.1 GTP-binding protein HSR1-related protein [Leptolyngbya boryana NIES-2135]MBD2370834.1 50S ribosome-binding GTPase [Leptolyngbya sp. FACHB-161]MBD2377168.1 50S ribosome-binding GTPase [Leptolyngbya sp. FACHB-238]MBD2401622.1 50S ribosome-binding GTPase [Leptolyngbya sp. FACHB-239]MBD2408175.1 50S ribosome-binding GTPase [Leptolyngbya sp. FACHB-402]